MIFNTHLIRQFILSLCGVFLLIIVVEWAIITVSPSAQLSPLSFSDPSQETKKLLSEFSALQAEDYTVLSASPLFVESRSPIEGEADGLTQGSVKQSSNTSLQIRLMGLTISAVDSLALVVDSKGTYSRLFVGDDIFGWKLISVEQNSATFNRLGKAITITLEKHQIGRVRKTHHSRKLRIQKPLSPPLLKK